MLSVICYMTHVIGYRFMYMYMYMIMYISNDTTISASTETI